MASSIEHRIVQADKLAVFTCNDEIDELQIRFYFIHNWKSLTRGMNNSTILFIGGVHGFKTGKLGPNEDIQTLKNQFSLKVLKNCNSEWILEDKGKRNIKFEFLSIPDFFKKETRVIDETGLVSKIQTINPQMIILVICYSEILDLKVLLETTGLFAGMRISRELNILSNGQILTMNAVQKEFIQTLALEDHVEKDVIVTGPVGSGKTLLGLEAINIKKSHYKKKYGISSSDCKNKIRVIIVIGDGNELKQQLEMSKSLKECSLDIETSVDHRDLDSEELTRIFQGNENYKSYYTTLIFIDEMQR